MPALVIGRQVPATINPTNVYRFTISQMSGDADSYNEESIDVEPDIAIQFAQLVDCIRSLSNGYNETSKKMVSAIKERMSDADLSAVVGDGHLEDLVSDIAGYDVMTDGQCLACVESYEITWFNDYGYEFEVVFEK